MNRFAGILTLIFFSVPLHAATDFVTEFSVGLTQGEDLANEVTRYHVSDDGVPSEEKYNQLERVDREIEQLLKQQPNNPVLWFVDGLNQLHLAALYANENKYIEKARALDAKNIAFQKAMQLDVAYEPHLTVQIYSVMKHGLPGNLKITAIQKELALGGNGENESYYWYLHWSNINELAKAGRFDEADTALQQMNAELEKRPDIDPAFRHLADRIDSSLKTERSQSEARAKTTTKYVAAKDDDINYQGEERKTLLLWIALAFLGLFVVIALIYTLVWRARHE